MRSMTGYGQAHWQHAGRSVGVEVRAVNQRFLEVKLNMPREYFPWEAELRALVQEQVARGKVDISILRGGANGGQVTVEANLALAKEYVAAWRKLQHALHLPGDIDLGLVQSRTELVRVVERRGDARGEIDAVRRTLRRALQAFNRDREREGRTLTRDMIARTRRLRQLQAGIARRVEKLLPQLAARLRQRLATLLEGKGIEEERIAQEAALITERSDVTEELVRLQSHLAALTTLLRGREPAGKRLDFLLQEVHREFNTIASKSADLEVTNLTLEARSEIEKLREQVQNVE
jgi:uncharacterized protein (TIGR00255 family)